MTTQTKTRRIRVTRQDIEKARQELTQAKESIPVSPKAKGKPKWGKDSWFGLVYCDSYGHAWIDEFEPVYLGKTDEIIPYLKSRGLDGENVAIVLIAAKEFQSDKKSQSCHQSKFTNENNSPPISTSVAPLNRATFEKQNPNLTRELYKNHRGRKSRHAVNSYSRLYRIWVGMKGRCYNPKNTSYYRYGARDIRVDDGWKDKFAVFKEWALANNYDDTKVIHRINNDGNYEPTNCKFLTRERHGAGNCLLRQSSQFLGLLDSLIAKGYGTPTIQSKLKEKGYDIAYRTLGRWVNGRKISPRTH